MGLTVGIDASRNRSGGARAYLKGMLSALDPEQHGVREVHVWAFKALLDSLPDRPWLVKHNPEPLERWLPHQVWWQAFSLTNEARREGCDILFSSDASTLCRFDPMVVLSQDMLSYEPGMMQRFNWGYQRLRLLVILYLQNMAFRRARGVIFLTRYAGEVIQRSCGALGRVATISHGVPDAFLAAPRPRPFPQGGSAPVRCVYVSPTSRYKNQWHVVRAIEMLRARGLSVTIDLVGGAEECAKARLQEQIRTSDPDGLFVRQVGTVPENRMVEQLSQADVFVFASSCENMPVTLLEAMAVGLPIACSSKGPMPEVLDDAGVYFDPEVPESIAAAIERLLVDRKLRERIAERARVLSGRYSWRRCATETFSFIDRTYSATTGTRPASPPRRITEACADITVLGYGFLGRSIVDGLAGKGRRLEVLCRTAPTDALVAGVSYSVGDVGDPDCLEAAIGSGLTVFAAGATFPVLPAAELQALAVREMELLKGVLARVARQGGQFAYLSSSAVYGEVPTGMARETDMPAPISAYGRHKLMCEQYCRQIARDLGVPLTVLRLSNPFGPRQISARRQGLIGIVIDNVRNNRVTQIRGDGEDIRDYVPVTVLSAVIGCLADATADIPEVLNVCSGEGLSTREVLDLLGSLLGRPIPVEYVSSIAGEIRRSVLDPLSLHRWSNNGLPNASFAAALSALTSSFNFSHR